MLQKLLFKIAKEPMMGQLIGYAFQTCSWAIPVRKASDNRDILSFHHPRPSYDHHLILSPKRAIRSLQELASDNSADCLMKIWKTVRELHETYPAYHDSFTLVANGGIRQEVQQLHFHMFANNKMANDAASPSAESMIFRDQDICILEHPNPNWDIHLVMRPAAVSQGDSSAYFRSVLRSVSRLCAACQLAEKGYSLVYQYEKQKDDLDHPVFHLIAGKRLARPS